MVDQAPATKADIERIESKLDHSLRVIGEVLEALKPSQRESDLEPPSGIRRCRRPVRSTILATAAGFDFADVLQRPPDEGFFFGFCLERRHFATVFCK